MGNGGKQQINALKFVSLTHRNLIIKISECVSYSALILACHLLNYSTEKCCINKMYRLPSVHRKCTITFLTYNSLGHPVM